MPNQYNRKQTGGGSSYLVYTALLTQSGTDAPIATILQNTLGIEPVWSYNSSGLYTLTATGLFIGSKTWVMVDQGFNKSTFIVAAINDDNDSIGLSVSDLSGTNKDDSLYLDSIEVRVYS